MPARHGGTAGFRSLIDEIVRDSARKMLAASLQAEVAAAFERDYGAKFPKAVAKIVDDTDMLLEFYHYPAAHWIHLRTTNPIESTFATVRLRSKSPGGRLAGGRARDGVQADRGR